MTECGPEGHAVASSNDHLFAVALFGARQLHARREPDARQDFRLFCLSSNTPFVRRLLEHGGKIAGVLVLVFVIVFRFDEKRICDAHVMGFL